MKTVIRRRYSERLNTEIKNMDANKIWPIAAAFYNIFAKNKMEASLSNSIVDRAVEGFFIAIGHEEQEIRKDYKSLGIFVANKVFGSYTKSRL